MLKRLIEVALPLKDVSEQSAREKSIRHGHISTLHIWWARRPLAACRAVVFASLAPDPDDPECPEDFRMLVRERLRRSEFEPKTKENRKPVPSMDGDPEMEAIVMNVVREFEIAQGCKPASVEEKNCRWVVASFLGGQTDRYIEVKGRAGVGGVALIPK
jgi:hypothetical protein